jgi:flagellar motor component MotA
MWFRRYIFSVEHCPSRSTVLRFVCGRSLEPKERLEAASEGAVVCRWLGALIGAIGIASNWDSQLETLGPAVAVMLLTIMYGYFLKVVICLVLLSRNGN